MFRDTIELETDKCRQSLYDGKSVKFKIKDSIPHDLGDPGKWSWIITIYIGVNLMWQKLWQLINMYFEL